MISWLVALLVIIVGGSLVLARIRARSRSQFDLGKVSQSWITEQRAGKQRDWS
jgi:hypothetical protein